MSQVKQLSWVGFDPQYVEAQGLVVVAFCDDSDDARVALLDLERIAATYAPFARFARVDITTDPQLCRKLGADASTVLIFQDSTLVASLPEALRTIPIEGLEEVLSSRIAGGDDCGDGSCPLPS